MNRVKKFYRNQRGDSIVEVLICIGVLGFIMAAAFALANRNQTTARQAQERAEAVQVANSQLELFKTYVDVHKLPPDPYFCVEANDTIAPLVSGPAIVPLSTVPTSPDTAFTYAPQCIQGPQGRYNVAIWSANGAPVPSANVGAGPNVWAVTVRWQSAGDAVANEEVKLFYTIYDADNPIFLSNTEKKNKFLAIVNNVSVTTSPKKLSGEVQSAL